MHPEEPAGAVRLFHGIVWKVYAAMPVRQVNTGSPLARQSTSSGRPVHFAGIHDSVKLPEVRNKWLAVQTEHSEHSAILTIVSICWHTHGNATGTEHPFVCDSF